MLLEVVREAPSHSKDGVDELLVLRVPLLRLGENLAKVVDGVLHSALLALFGPLDHHNGADDAVGGGDVHEHGLLALRGRHDWRLGEDLLQGGECIVRLAGPLEWTL